MEKGVIGIKERNKSRREREKESKLWKVEVTTDLWNEEEEEEEEGI